MEKEQYLNDLKDIKEMMSRSSRFISLSGGSGISVGLIALAGAWAAWQSVYKNLELTGYGKALMSDGSLTQLLGIAAATLLVALVFGIYFTTRETKKRQQKIWDQQTRRLLVNLAIPLLAGGILCLTLLLEGFAGLMPGLTLIFYGLALVHTSKYTINELRSLGLLEIALGLIAVKFIALGLLFWALGFGILQIVYGIVVPKRYKS